MKTRNLIIKLRFLSSFLLIAGLTVTSLTGCLNTDKQTSGMNLSQLQKLSEVDERFQSYNVEMVEITGGEFWAPYQNNNGERYRQRPPIDLDNTRLRNLTRQLAPAYMRVSGTWANSTYVATADENLSAPPTGFRQVLTPRQWQGVVEFSREVDAPIVTSFPVSEGTRDSNGVWKPQQAQRLLDLTRQFGTEIYAAEFFNEPNAAWVGGLPKGYAADDYVRDFRIFSDWIRSEAPQTRVIGPGSVGEGALAGMPPGAPSLLVMIPSTEMMNGNPDSLDAVSYHFYGGASQRCASMENADKQAALTPEWLDKTLREYDYYSTLRDEYEPDKPLWLTETAQAACGGSPWAATFLDTFRYLNQLGLLAQKGVSVVMHNTLAASDYALIDHETLEPRPNYWAAVLWKRNMGSTVLQTPVANAQTANQPESGSPELRLYAHCLPQKNGGVGMVALNIGNNEQKLTFRNPAKIWLMTASPLESTEVTVNGSLPSLSENGDITGLGPTISDQLVLPARSVAFAGVPEAGNPACQ